MLFPYWVVVLAAACGHLVIAHTETGPEVNLTGSWQSSGETEVNEETQVNEAWMSPPGHLYVRRNVEDKRQSDQTSNQSDGSNMITRNQDNKLMPKQNITKNSPPYIQHRSGYGYARPGHVYGAPPRPLPLPGPAYTPHVPLIPLPGPMYPATGGYSYGPNYGTTVGTLGPSDLLLAGVFTQDKCKGAADLLSGYVSLLTFERQGFCARALKSLTCSGIQTVTSKNTLATSVNRIQPLVTLIEPRGSQLIVVVMGLSYEGSAEGKFIAVRGVFTYGQLYRFCSGLLGSSHMTSDDAILIIADLPAATLLDCHDLPQGCFDKVRQKKQLECEGQVFAS